MTSSCRAGHTIPCLSSPVLLITNCLCLPVRRHKTLALVIALAFVATFGLFQFVPTGGAHGSLKDMNSPVNVHVLSVVPKQHVRGPAHLLHPGRSGNEASGSPDLGTHKDSNKHKDVNGPYLAIQKDSQAHKGTKSPFVPIHKGKLERKSPSLVFPKSKQVHKGINSFSQLHHKDNLDHKDILQVYMSACR